MLRLSGLLSAFAFACLFLSPQAQACIMGTRETFFFDTVPEQLLDADVIAQVRLLADIGDTTEAFLKGTPVTVGQVIKTSDSRVRQGDTIAVKSNPTMTCTRNRFKNGDQGTIIAKAGSDKDGRPVLCLYTHDRGRLKSPWADECLPDEVEATNPTRIAAEKGDVKAQIDLAVIYHSGREVKKNKAEAMKWLTRAGENGNALAQFIVGEEYRYDDNIAEALKWYKLAADQGYADAMYTLGWIYRYGHYGAKKDEAEATRWYRLAAEKGHEQAQQALEIMRK